MSAQSILFPRLITFWSVKAEETIALQGDLILEESYRGVVKYLMVAIGGALGAVVRMGVGAYVGNRMGTRFPYGTFVINCSGSFLIGLILTVLSDRTHLSPNWRYLIPIGFIGAYTTFSTFEYETLLCLQEGQMLTAFLNVILSLIVGFAAVWLGIMTGKALA